MANHLAKQSITEYSSRAKGVPNKIRVTSSGPVAGIKSGLNEAGYSQKNQTFLTCSRGPAFVAEAAYFGGVGSLTADSGYYGFGQQALHISAPRRLGIRRRPPVADYGGQGDASPYQD